MILTANPGPSVCSSNSVLGILGGLTPSPRELRYHLAGERRHTYLKRQVVLSMTLVSLSLERSLWTGWSRRTAWLLWHLSQVLERGNNVQLEPRRRAQPRTTEGHSKQAVWERQIDVSEARGSSRWLVSRETGSISLEHVKNFWSSSQRISWKET